MNALQKFSKKFPLVFGILFPVVLLLLYKILGAIIPVTTIWIKVGVEYAVTALAVVIALLFMKPTPFYKSWAGAKFGFKKAIYLIILNCLFGLGTFVFTSIMHAHSNFFVDSFLPCLILCLAIGVFEELLFRVGLFGGLLAKMGNSTKGIIWAAIISSLAFGFCHNVDAFISGYQLTLPVIGQIVGKTVETAAIGIFLCAIYLKTRNFWVISILHAIFDFVIFVGSPVGTTGGMYVNPDQPFMCFAYLGLVILYLPAIISSFRMLKSVKTPEYGILVADEYAPRIPEEPKKSKK